MTYEEFVYLLLEEKRKSVPVYSVPEIDTTVFNGDTTVVLWKDGKKTIVTKEPDKPHDPYAGFCAAVCKRLFGGTDKVMRVIERTDKAVIAWKKAEAAALQKEKNRAHQEELRRKAEARREMDEKELMDELVRQYLLEAKAKKRAEEIMGGQIDVPFDATKEGG